MSLETKANLYEGLVLPQDANTSFGVFGVRSDGVTPIFDAYSQFKVSEDGKSITGDSPFDNVALVYRNADNDPFQYDKLALWDGGEHTFYAYYINGSEFHPSLSVKKKDEFSSATKSVISNIGIDDSGVYMQYVQPTTLESMVDVMTANTTTSRTENNEVALSFEHRLFAFDIVVRNNQILDSDFKAQKLVVKSSKATFQVHAGGFFYFNATDDLLSTTTCSVEKEFGSFEIRQPTSDNIREYNLNRETRGSLSFLFLPCASLKIKFEMTYVNRWGDDMPYTYDSIDGNDPPLTVEGGFQAGQKYKFTIVKNNFGSEFEFVPQIAVVNDEDKTEGSWNNKDVDHEFN